MTDKPEDEIRITRHKTFWVIANEQHRFVNRCCVERQARRVKTDRDVDFQCWKNAQIQRAAMISVVFSALTLEAFINDYGISNFSKTFFDTYLDRLSPATKWMIIPRLKTGKQLNPQGPVIHKLSSLFKQRDKLVHHKTVIKPVSEAFNKHWLDEKHSEEALSTVQLLVKELAKIDQTVDVSWLEIEDSDIYA
jgi:hypothetical protein